MKRLARKKSVSNNKKIILIIVIIFIVCALCAVVFLFERNGSAPDRNALINRQTKMASAYSLEIIKPQYIENDAVNTWFAGILNGPSGGIESYHTLYNNGSENLDMYLFIPGLTETAGNVSLSSFNVTESGTALVIYIDTENERTDEDTPLIFHIYATSQNAQAKSERLIVNGRTYACASATFTVLR
jgi:ABC-type cobalt transport system substrate-binding protein